MKNPQKVHKSIRIDAGLAGRVSALRDGDESDAATYSRVILAGVETLEGRPVEEDEAQVAPPSGDGVAEALRDHLETLKAQLSAATAQLATKDEQIAALTRLTEQAQTLHALESAKALEAPQDRPQAVDEEQAEERPGLWTRLRSWLG